MYVSFINNLKLTNKELILLFTSLSYAKSAGMTFRTAIIMMLDNKDNKVNPKSLRLMLQGFDDGLELSEIMQQHENIFAIGIWRQMYAAERSGKEKECLDRIIEQLKHKSSIINKIRGALAYPIIVLIIAFAACVYLMLTVIPEMTAMLVDLGGEIPPLTQFMITLSNLFIEHAVLAITLIVCGIAFSIWAILVPFKLHWHRFILNFPLSHDISVNLNYSIFYMLITDMVQNGISVVDAMRVSAASTTNMEVTNQLLSSADSMAREGFSMAEALQSAKSMPHDDRMMLKIGSETGREIDLMKTMSDQRRQMANEAVDLLLKIMEPLLTILMCAIVGVLVVAVYLPMLTMATALS